MIIHPAFPRGRCAFALLAASCLAAGAATAQEFKVSGQINRLLMHADDGRDTRFAHADNVNSQTRLRAAASWPLTAQLAVGANWEDGYTVNPSSRVSMADGSIAATFNPRHADIWLAGDWGRFSLGRGDGAANGGMENDLSGTTAINYAGIVDIGGNFTFRRGAAFGPTIAATLGDLDFESRYIRRRYDTPRFGPLALSFSDGTKDGHRVSELALWHVGESAAGRWAATLGVSRERHGGVAGNEDTAGGSVSWLAPAGLNLTLALGGSADEYPARPRKRFAYAKVGHLSGRHALSLDHGRGRDFQLAGDSSTMTGIGYVFTATTWAELYAGVKRHDLRRPGADFAPVLFYLAGARLKF